MKERIFEAIDKLVKGTEETVDYTIEKVNETRKTCEQDFRDGIAKTHKK